MSDVYRSYFLVGSRVLVIDDDVEICLLLKAYFLS